MINESVFPPERVTIVGILNVTPDSFSDGGRLLDARGRVSIDRILASAGELIDAGADILDVGGESTRPGAEEIPVAEEIARTRETIALLSERFRIPVSIDTRKAEVAEEALDAGACIVNDVSGLNFDSRMAAAVARSQAILILGHARGIPRTMQDDPRYGDVLSEVLAELGGSIEKARLAGIPTRRLVIDPGIGFGKRLDDNLQLIAHAGWLRDKLGLPLLVGPSRKGFLGELTGDPIESRDQASAAACAVAAFAGADGVRVHDVAAARRAVAVGRALGKALRKDRP